MQALAKELEQQFGSGLKLSLSVSAKELTTFKLGGLVPLLLEPSSTDALSELIFTLNKKGQSWRVIGQGSNVVISDSGLSDVVVKLSNTSVSNINPEEVNLESGSCLSRMFLAGEPLIKLSRVTANEGLSGLEFAAGIPGSIGGAVAMNAGAHDSSISDIFEKAWICNGQGDILEKTKEDLDFTYRDCKLESDEIVIAAQFKFEKKDPKDIKEKRKSCLDYRTKTQPLQMPSAGSVFTNPDADNGIYAAKLLEEAGFKGKASHGVEFSKMHANWLVKVGDEALSQGVFDLIDEASDHILSTKNICLNPEIKSWS